MRNDLGILTDQPRDTTEKSQMPNSKYKQTKKHLKVLLAITASTLLLSWPLKHYLIPKPPLLGRVTFSQAIYDSNHNLLRLTLSKDEKYRIYTPLTQMAPQAIALTLLQEDQYFYWHPGVNPVALIKATWKTYVTHNRRIGASTITMQVARLLFKINSKTWRGKLRQIARAIQLEIHYSKQEILTAYLNIAPYGNNIEGIGAASLIYFAKTASNLNLAEILALVVMPQNPLHHALSPRTNTAEQNLRPKHDRRLTSRHALWQRWLLQHPTDRNYAALIDLPLPTKAFAPMPFLAPHFVTAVIQHNPRISSHGVLPISSIVTTIDLNLQRIIENITRNYLERQKKFSIQNAAVMLVDIRDMSVKALLGSSDFFRRDIGGQINGTTMKRSPGSTLKPFIYALALDQGLIHPETMLKDVPTSFRGYNPENFDNDFMGPLSATNALILSRNVPAIYLANKLIKPNLYQFLQHAATSQMRPESFYGLSLGLGGVEVSMQELITMYAVLGNSGFWRPLRMLKDDPIATGKKLLSPEAGFLVLNMLKDTLRPTGFEPNLCGNNKTFIPVAWKTGTSSGYRDAWTIGVFGPYVLAVWLGDFAGSSNMALVGKSMAAPLFFTLVNALIAHDRNLPDLISNPRHFHQLNLTKTPVCTTSGMIPTRYCQDRKLTWFIPGKSPIKKDTIYREVAIDRKTGRRTCRFDQNTDFAIYEFWSSDLLKLWQQAGIKRRTPPPFIDGCDITKMNHANNEAMPQINSPQPGIKYAISVDRGGVIPLIATVDADVKTLYWFIDRMYIGSVSPSQPLWWRANIGKFTVRVIDDHGRTTAENLEIIGVCHQS